MSLDGIFKGMSPSVSGLRAERLRMEVVATNIANANSTRVGESGEPYRRRLVVFQPALDQALGAGGALPGGVMVAGVIEDQTPQPVVHRPGHPDADELGYLTLPNVNLAAEMVDLATSTRAYEANLAAVRAFKTIGEQALQIGSRA